jgi:hypothetical protein
MKHLLLLLAGGFLIHHPCFSQSRRQDIYTEFALYQKRKALEKDLRERIVAKTFSSPPDSNSMYQYESACDAIAQFQLSGPEIEHGLTQLSDFYDSLDYYTKRAFLEAAYAVYPKKFNQHIKEIIEKENNPKLFSMCAVYLYRIDSSVDNTNFLKIKMVEQFPGYDTIPILKALGEYLNNHHIWIHQPVPDPVYLFRHQRSTGQKIIYSFQRWNRDYPGLAIVQNADGHFVKDANGKLLVFEQLARSGSDLPYFITNGSTPQGVYSIQGTDVSKLGFIGPTPNIQLIMPYESSWNNYFHEQRDPAPDSLLLYRQLLPPEWRDHAPMMEVWNAGKIGRTEIIAHGSTIDPEYFKDKPYYPLTPTQGCLCAKELWNPTSGHLLVSEQFNLVSAFQSTPGSQGYLYVVNIDDQQKPVGRQEIEAWVKRFEPAIK